MIHAIEQGQIWRKDGVTRVTVLIDKIRVWAVVLNGISVDLSDKIDANDLFSSGWIFCGSASDYIATMQ